MRATEKALRRSRLSKQKKSDEDQDAACEWREEQARYRRARVRLPAPQLGMTSVCFGDGTFEGVLGLAVPGFRRGF